MPPIRRRFSPTWRITSRFAAEKSGKQDDAPRKRFIDNFVQKAIMLEGIHSS